MQKALYIPKISLYFSKEALCTLKFTCNTAQKPGVSPRLSGNSVGGSGRRDEERREEVEGDGIGEGKGLGNEECEGKKGVRMGEGVREG